MNRRVAETDRLPAAGIAVGLAVTGLMVGVGLTYTVGLLFVALGHPVGALARVVLSVVLMQGVAFGAVAVAYLGVRGLGFGYLSVRIPTFRDGLWVASGYVLALLAAFAGAMLVFAAGVTAAPNQISEIGIQNPRVLLALIPLSLLLVGPGEELLFRGVVQRTLRESFGPVVAVVVASAIFAAVHVVALSGGPSGRLVTVSVLFLPSLVFGATYELSDNLAVPSLVHGAYNATLFALLYIAVRHGPTVPVAG